MLILQHRALTLRISVTERCQLRCLYCTPPCSPSIKNDHGILSFNEILRFVRMVKSGFGLSKVCITGGEPLVRTGIVDLVGLLAREGIPDITLTTNGQLLGNMASDLKKAGLQRVNISLDTLAPETYRRLTLRGNIQRTLIGIDKALHSGLFPVKLNVTVMRGVNTEELVDLAHFGLQLGCQVRFLELMPLSMDPARYSEWFFSSAEVRLLLADAFDLSPEPVKPGSSSRDYTARTQGRVKGLIGFISSRSTPFCQTCRRLRLTANGQLIGCLAQGDGQNIQPMLLGEGAPDTPQLTEAIHSALCSKRKRPHFNHQSPMFKIGG